MLRARARRPASRRSVLLMTSPEATETVVHDCAEAGIRRVWMYRATGKGSVSAKALAFCQEQGMRVVPGQCPFCVSAGRGGPAALVPAGEVWPLPICVRRTGTRSTSRMLRSHPVSAQTAGSTFETDPVVVVVTTTATGSADNCDSLELMNSSRVCLATLTGRP